MKLTIESTDVVVQIRAAYGGDKWTSVVEGRVWEGTTESGIPVQVLVTRVAVGQKERQDEFERELKVQHAPRPEPLAFPLRMVL